MNQNVQTLNQKAHSLYRNVDPKGKANVDNEWSTKTNYMRRRHPVRQRFTSPKRQQWYVPKFHGYYYQCNKFRHIIVDCSLMHKPPNIFESRNPFVALREMNVICYECNGVGHRSYECRRSLSLSYNNFSNLSFNANIK